ncbi:hypothetical protein ACWEOZ_04550 [Actinoplanes sp. NPDC004185]
MSCHARPALRGQPRTPACKSDRRGQDGDPEWIAEAKKLVPKQRVTPAWSEKNSGELQPFRLWLGWYNLMEDWTAPDTAAYEEAVSEVPVAFRPSARYTPIGMVEDPADDGRLSTGDRVIMLGLRDARLADFRSIRAVPGNRNRRFMALYRRDHQLPRVTNAAVGKASLTWARTCHRTKGTLVDG